MSIKFRLILSYIAMLIIPIVLTILVSILSVGFYFGDTNKNIAAYNGLASIKKTMMLRDSIFSEVKTSALKTPDKFGDESFLKELDEKAFQANSGIIVRRNDQIVYLSPLLDKFDYKQYLPAFGSYAEDLGAPGRGKIKRFILNQHDFYFDDKSSGSIFLVTDIGPLESAYIKTSITVTIFVIVALVLTNGLLTYLVARSIINPLNRLKTSANKIKEGELDFEVRATTKDEIGELCIAFEEMRARLKESYETQQLYENNRKELISNISHDLKTPITAIKGYVEGIRDGIADSLEKRDLYVDTIYSKTNHIDKLINELFLYSMLDLNKIPFDFTRVVISGYLGDILDELRFDLHGKSIALDYSEDVPENTEVTADVQQLKRVVTNIIENAVKYMDKEQGSISVHVRDKDSQVEVEIRDNGKGISGEELSYIFDRFYRADKSRNTEVSGSGLGLSIAKKIIEEHGGQMWAESVEGSGTSIFFTLRKYKSGGMI